MAVEKYCCSKGYPRGGGLTQRHRTLLVCTWSVWVTAMGLKGVGSAVGACVSLRFRSTTLLPVRTLAHRLHGAYLDFATCRVGHHFRVHLRLHCTHGAHGCQHIRVCLCPLKDECCGACGVCGAGLAGAGTGPSTVPVGASAVAYHNITSGDGEMNGLSVTLALCLRHGAPVTLYKPLSVVKAPPPPMVAHLTPFVFFFLYLLASRKRFLAVYSRLFGQVEPVSLSRFPSDCTNRRLMCRAW